MCIGHEGLSPGFGESGALRQFTSHKGRSPKTGFGRNPGHRVGLLFMAKHPILDVPLDQVIRPDIAMPLQQMLRLYTVGNLLSAWRSPRNQRSIEQIFESPAQARHAIAVCTTWLGYETAPLSSPVPAWWIGTTPIAAPEVQ